MDYQGNTRKEREKAAKKDEPEKVEKNIEKVVTGEVIQKPKSLGRRFKETFFSGDAKNAARFVGQDVLLPALQNLTLDMLTKGAERLIFGESRYKRRPPTVNYNAARSQYPQSRSYLADRPFSSNPLDVRSHVRQNRHEMNDIIVGTKAEADLVIERLNDIIDRYDVVSLADLNDLLGLPTSHIDNKWGWTFLGGVNVHQNRQGYLLELPPLEEI